MALNAILPKFIIVGILMAAGAIVKLYAGKLLNFLAIYYFFFVTIKAFNFLMPA